MWSLNIPPPKQIQIWLSVSSFRTLKTAFSWRGGGGYVVSVLSCWFTTGGESRGAVLHDESFGPTEDHQSVLADSCSGWLNITTTTRCDVFITICGKMIQRDTRTHLQKYFTASWPKNPWSQFPTVEWLVLAPAQQQCEISYCLRIRPVQTLNISSANQNILQGRTVALPEITEVKWAIKQQKQRDSSVAQQDFINHFGLAILKAHSQ